MNIRQPRTGLGRFGEIPSHDPGTNVLGGGGSGSDDAALWALVESQDPADQKAAAMSTRLSDEQVDELAGHDRPFTSRLAVATRTDPHAARVAADDPDPVVRARVLQSGVTLDTATRTRLEGDPRVVRARNLLGFGPGGRMLSDGRAAGSPADPRSGELT